MHFSIQMKLPQMNGFMFVSASSESKPLGVTQLIYFVVLANGLAESCPDTFELLQCTEL